MRAITIRQPWASLLVLGYKQFETRSWKTSYRGPIAIHAGLMPVRRTLGALAAQGSEGRETVALIERLLEQHGGVDHVPTGAIIGTANLERCNAVTVEFVAGLSMQEFNLGDFTPGRYAWEFSGMSQIMRPIPAIGSQGLWTWEVLT